MSPQLTSRLDAIHAFQNWLSGSVTDYSVADVGIWKDLLSRTDATFVLYKEGDLVGRFTTPAAALASIQDARLTDDYLHFILHHGAAPARM